MKTLMVHGMRKHFSWLSSAEEYSRSYAGLHPLAVSLALVVLMGVGMTDAAQASGGRDLTPEVRKALFAPTHEVALAHRVETIPLEGVDHRGFYKCPYMRVYVNRRGPFTFLFDTGASYTLVSGKVVEAAATPVVFDRGGQRDVVVLAQITIGGVTLKNVQAIHDDNFGVDGIFGFGAFGTSNLLFDLAARRLRVSAAPIPLRQGFELPYETPFNVPTVPLRLGGRVIRSLIDTGDDAYGLELRQVELGDARLTHPPVAADAVLNGATVQPTHITMLADSVGLGPTQADGAVVSVNDGLPVGDIGYAVIRQFRIEFEPARRVVVFQPLFAGRKFIIPGNLSPGLSLAFDGTGKVARVVPGSGADRAGMASGDVIVSLDGKPACSLAPRAWDALMERRRPLSVHWTHDGAAREAQLPIEEVH